MWGNFLSMNSPNPYGMGGLGRGNRRAGKPMQERFMQTTPVRQSGLPMQSQLSRPVSGPFDRYPDGVQMPSDAHNQMFDPTYNDESSIFQRQRAMAPMQQATPQQVRGGMRQPPWQSQGNIFQGFNQAAFPRKFRQANAGMGFNQPYQFNPWMQQSQMMRPYMGF